MGVTVVGKRALAEKNRNALSEGFGFYVTTTIRSVRLPVPTDRSGGGEEVNQRAGFVNCSRMEPWKRRHEVTGLEGLTFPLHKGSTFFG